MRNYTSLDITVKDAAVARELEKILPERYKHGGAVIFPTNPSYGYKFDPVLTKKEIIGLTGKLIDFDVKRFTFTDTRSLSQND